MVPEFLLVVVLPLQVFVDGFHHTDYLIGIGGTRFLVGDFKGVFHHLHDKPTVFGQPELGVLGIVVHLFSVFVGNSIGRFYKLACDEFLPIVPDVFFLGRFYKLACDEFSAIVP